MNTLLHKPSVVDMPLQFSENDTFALAELLAAVAKEEPITAKHREFAAMLFVRMDNAVKASQLTKRSSSATPIRADLRPAPFARKHPKKGKR